MEHFHLYVYGAQFAVIIDHKPLKPQANFTAVNLAHGGHQGIVKTKQLIRDKVWFPGIDKLPEEKIKNCFSFQAASTKSPPLEPPRMTPPPSAPCKEVAEDFAGPFLSGDDIMVVTDEFSRFPEVEILTSTSARLDAIWPTI